MERRLSRITIFTSEKVLFAFFIYVATRLLIAPSVHISAADHRHWADFPSIQIIVNVLFAMAIKLVRKLKNQSHRKWATGAVLILGGLMLFSAPRFFPIFGTLTLFILAVVYRSIIQGSDQSFQWSPLLNELRKWWVLLFVICIYPLVPLILRSTQTQDRDGFLASVDRFLFIGRERKCARRNGQKFLS